MLINRPEFNLGEDVWATYPDPIHPWELAEEVPAIQIKMAIHSIKFMLSAWSTYSILKF